MSWLSRVETWKKWTAVALFFGGLLVTAVLWGERISEATGLPEPFAALRDTTHRHFSWAESHDVEHDEEHNEFLEAADSIVHIMREVQTRLMKVDARQRWMECDEKMEDDIAAGRIPRDCPPEIIVPGGGG